MKDIIERTSKDSRRRSNAELVMRVINHEISVKILSHDNHKRVKIFCENCKKGSLSTPGLSLPNP